MENESSVQKRLEELKNELAEVSKKIIDLDAKGEKGQELNDLHNKHEELTRQIEELPNEDELHKAA